jgi:hypothetical protein
MKIYQYVFVYLSICKFLWMHIKPYQIFMNIKLKFAFEFSDLSTCLHLGDNSYDEICC